MKEIHKEVAERIKIDISCQMFSENRAVCKTITKNRTQREKT